MFVGSASASLARDYSNCTCGEGYDLTDLNLTGVQGDLVKEIYATGKPVVLILVTGRPFSVTWERNIFRLSCSNGMVAKEKGK